MNSKCFAANVLIPYKKGQRCQLIVTSSKARMKIFNEEMCADITPVFFPASKVPSIATHIEVVAQMAFVARSPCGQVCLLVKQVRDNVYSLPEAKVRKNWTLLGTCYAFVDQWVDHDWWFKQLAVMEDVPNASTHLLYAVHGQWLPAIYKPLRDNYFWTPVERLMTWDESNMSKQLHQFVHSSVCEAWCRRYASLYS
jgi:hypothetical protein